MRGTIFVEFFDLVERAHGLDTVDEIIASAECQLQTNGAYTSVGNYPHEELLALATALSTITGTGMKDIIELFAQQLIEAFQRMHPDHFSAFDDVFKFLLSVDQRIHADVRKIYPDARPPVVTGEMKPDGNMVLNYSSSRPLAQLALALVTVSGKHFNQPLTITTVQRSDDDRSITLHLSKRT